MAQKVDITRDDYAVFYAVTSRWQDNDSYGYVSNATYYDWFDTAANSFLVQQCRLDIIDGELMGLVVSSGCEYLSPIRFPDRVEVGLRIERLGRSSVQYSVAIFKEKTEQACAFGHFVQVFVDRLSRKPEAIPAAMRKTLQKIAVSEP